MRKTYDIVFDIAKGYFYGFGYDMDYLNDFFSSRIFKEIVVIRLANSNVVIKNKTDKTSHQTHIAITGDSIDFFYNREKFDADDNVTSDILPVLVSKDNLNELHSVSNPIQKSDELMLVSTGVTVGSRTQRQVQLSKRISGNGPEFNELRNGLFEDDLLLFFKYRGSEKILGIGIKKEKYRSLLPEVESRFETFTYLVVPQPKNN